MTISNVDLLKSLRVDVSKLTLSDLNVPANTEVTLTVNDPKFAQYVSYVTPQSVAELKTLIGVSDTALAKASGATPTLTKAANPAVANPVIANPAVLAGRVGTTSPMPLPQSATIRDQAHRFVFGDSRTLDAGQVAKLNQWVIAQKIRIPIFHLQDITVGSGATLKITALSLLARNIVIEKKGIIKTGTVCSIHASKITGN